MGRVSRRKIHPELEERMFEVFWEYLASLRDTKDIKVFLVSLLSYTEQVMLVKRLAIAILLSKGNNYEYIDETLKVSKSTVGTVHKQIMTGAEGYRRAVDHILKESGKQRLWNDLEELIIKLSLPKQYGSPEWEQKSAAGKAVAKKRRKLSTLFCNFRLFE